ncbi:MAG TPA: preprotein translocase subunit SecY [Elusimicrobia bacterium]|nr:MAG: preprotein translocase subunit SecY [Elusimicrobia bacterium GWA2_64_40]OGR68098.1 MAG: preprotein translocase subunit SecY [Elusimicrobia bacterium GWB2_63_16]HAN05896.1 preprotein translocase subunit SecY [Elusimicrobiota bacterium]HAU89369.1 preprotein translocase subunit SecY [Elusimicrobiota bacterium]
MQQITDIFKIQDLKKRIFFVLGALAVYRLGASIPIPGINTAALQAIFEAQKGSILGFLDIFSGGALGRFSLFSMGVMPYINASIIMSLVQGAHIFPVLDRLQKEGESGRKKITQFTRYFTLFLAAFQSLGLTIALTKMQAGGGPSIVTNPTLGFYFVTVLTLVAGTMFVMWLGEQVTERGIGNGISLIIFAGIVGGLPSAVMGMIKLVQVDEISLLSGLIILAMVFLIVAFVIWVQTAQRKIPVQYAQRMVGRKMMGGASTFLPLKVDQSGVIAVIFAVSLLSVPYTIGSFNPNAAWSQKLMSYMSHTSLLYQAAYVALIIFFCYFYNSVSINPKDLAENMKKWGGFIPGIRPGEPTASHIEWVMNRITLGGAIFVSLIAVLPDYLRAKFNVPFYFGGTSLLIVVGVALDTIAQTEAHLVMRNYEGFYKNSRIKGRWFNVGT